MVTDYIAQRHDWNEPCVVCYFTSNHKRANSIVCKK